MRTLLSIFTFATLWLLVASDGNGAIARLQELKELRAEQMRTHLKHRNSVDFAASRPFLKKRASPFLNSKSEKFAVNGSALPDVDFDVGESYAGVLPISDSPDEERQLYFWFFPSTNDAAKNEITIWLQGKLTSFDSQRNVDELTLQKYRWTWRI